MDHTKIGLNNRLQSINSLSVRRGTESFNPPTDFESQVERGAVTRGKMGTITADVITGGTMSASLIGGGTLNLGGTNNTSGVLSLKDEGGTEKILMDKDGMVVSDGKITINNPSGSTVLDSYGLNSSVNFWGAGTNGTDTLLFAGTAWQSVAGGTLPPMILSRTTNVYNYLNVSVFDYGCFGFIYGEFGLWDGTTLLQNLPVLGNLKTQISVDGGGHVGTISYAVSSQIAYTGAILPLEAGTHTLILKGRSEGGGTANLASWSIGANVLGG